MKGILIFLLLFGTPHFTKAALLSYNFSGYAEDLSTGDDHYLSMDFVVDNELWLLSELEVEFLGKVWTPTSNNDFSISIWLDIPEVQPTYWLDWALELTNGQNVIDFQSRPEWKIYHNNGSVADDPLSYLDQSYFTSELISLDNNRLFGLSGRFRKVVDVSEPASIYIFILGGVLIIGLSLLGKRCSKMVNKFFYFNNFI